MTDYQQLASIIKDIQFTMMTTVDDQGRIVSRPMATQRIDVDRFDGKLWFFTKLDSPKVHCIEHDQHVNLAYANPDKQQYVSVVGRGQVVTDQAKMKELWNPLLKAWFPEGLEDPELALICVDVESAEIWDAPPSKVVQLVGFVKAGLTGKPYQPTPGSKEVQFGEKPIH